MLEPERVDSSQVAVTAIQQRVDAFSASGNGAGQGGLPLSVVHFPWEAHQFGFAAHLDRAYFAGPARLDCWTVAKLRGVDGRQTVNARTNT